MVEEKRLRSLRIRIFFGLVVVIVVVAGLTWARKDFSPHSYGIKSITLPNNRIVYVKREIGIRYDRTSLSLNGERCKKFDDKSDYRFASQDAGAFAIYYLPGVDALTIYSDLAAPAQMKWPITVIAAPLDAKQSDAMEASSREKGIQKVRLDVSEMAACR